MQNVNLITMTHEGPIREEDRFLGFKEVSKK